MAEVFLSELLMLNVVAFVWVGGVIRRDKSKTSRALMLIVEILFLWIIDDMCITLRPAWPIGILRVLDFLSYTMGSVILWCYCYYCKAMIEEFVTSARRWFGYGTLLFVFNMTVITISYWSGSIEDLNTFEIKNGMPVIVSVIQILLTVVIPMIIVRYDKNFGMGSAIILSLFGIFPALTTYVASLFGSADFSVVATTIYALAVVEIAQNANTFKRNIEQNKALEAANQQLVIAKESADQANKAKGQFLANMSHEIRTPINVVLGMDTMILRKSREKDIIGYANNIQLAGRSLLSLINDILDFSKIESGKFELVKVNYDFASLITDIYNMINAKASEKELEFDIVVDETIPCVLFGDDVRIKQVLVNLLTNAVKYTHKGKVTLKITRLDYDSDENAKIHFAVTDTGIGIKEEDISKLTEQFVRLEESRNRNIEGTGLGINIVVNLLHLMNSRLEVNSVYGEGSEFSFDLIQPITNAEPIGDYNNRIEISENSEEGYSASLCIPDASLLVVDDNAMNRAVFSGLLEGLQCRIDEAESGQQCLEMVKTKEYDIIFMDHMMPDMDGIETLHHMKELGDYLNCDTPVVILTANAISGAKEEYLNQGFTEYLSKPIDAIKLENLIDKLISADKKQVAVKTERRDISSDSDETDIDELPYIDGIDWKHAISKMNSLKLLKDSVRRFSQMAESEMESLNELYEAIDRDDMLESYRIKVHSMKSSAATIGADQLSGLAKYLEYAAKEKNIDTIQRLMPLFNSEWIKMKSLLDEGFGYREETTEELPPMDNGELAEFLIILREAMTDGDMDRADAVVEELQNHFYPEEQKKYMEDLKLAVLNIDLEKCDTIIDNWMAATGCKE